MMISGQSSPESAVAPVAPVRIRSAVPLPVTGSDGSRVAATIFSFDGLADGREHVALAYDRWDENDPVLVRLHSECLTGDVLGSRRCDCGPQLAEAHTLLQAEGGVLLYLRQEGRGIGLYNKLDAYLLQDDGLDTYAANRALRLAEDARDFGIGAAMLGALGIARCELLSNNPDKERGLSEAGIEVVHRRSTSPFESEDNWRYLADKLDRGHRWH